MFDDSTEEKDPFDWLWEDICWNTPYGVMLIPFLFIAHLFYKLWLKIKSFFKKQP